MPLTILVADDNFGTRLAVTDYLEIQGYQAIAAADGLSALTMVEQFRPNLIVTDIAMPEMDGHELIKRVRSQPQLRLLPVVFLSERRQTEDRILGYQLGCDAYLAKPFELSELGAVVRNLLDRVQMMTTELQFLRHPFRENEANVPVARTSVTRKPFDDRNLDFSQRELEVVRLISDGLSNIQIGSHLHLSPRTVEKHVGSLLRKTEMNNRAELVRYAIEHHLVT
jgi:DNA-binding NarL/FixJ family response regulator